MSAGASSAGSAFHRDPLSLDGFKLDDDPPLTPYKQDGLVLKCDIMDDAAVMPLTHSFLTEDEAQRLFTCLDRGHKGFVVYEDLLAYGMSNEDAEKLWARFVVRNGKLNFNDFLKLLEAVNEELGELNVGDRTTLLMSESGASILSRIVTVGVMMVILCSTMSFIAETMPQSQHQPEHCKPDCAPKPNPWFATLELVCIAVFTVEYTLRVLSISFVSFNLDSLNVEIDVVGHRRIYDLAPRHKRLMNYVLMPMNMIDFLAIAPYYIELAMGSGGGLGFLRVLRLTRIFRIFKMSKYSTGATLLARTLLKSLPALQLLIFFSLIGLTVFASMMYFVEVGTWTVNDEWPEGQYLTDPNFFDPRKENQVPSTFTNIPRCFWYVLVTATTVGYGDMVPVSDLGKVLGAVTMVAGLLVIALPITVLGSNFAQEYQRLQEETEWERVERELRRIHRNALVASGKLQERDWGLNAIKDGLCGKADSISGAISGMISGRRQGSGGRQGAGAGPVSEALHRSLVEALTRVPEELASTAPGATPSAGAHGGHDEGGAGAEGEPTHDAHSGAATGAQAVGATRPVVGLAELRAVDSLNGDDAGPAVGSAALRTVDPKWITRITKVDPKITLKWVAVMRAYKDAVSTICLWRDDARLSKTASEVLMDEAFSMISVAAQGDVDFVAVMPYLNTAVNWITRCYKDPDQVLDRRRGMELIQKFLEFSQIICSANITNFTASAAAELPRLEIPSREDLLSGIDLGNVGRRYTSL